MMDASDLLAIRDRLILAALPHVTFDGWSAAALREAAADEGLDSTMPERLFPGGAIDAVAHFVGLADRLMVEDLADTDLEALRVPQRISALIGARLARWQPHREAVRRATTLLALPGNMGVAARLAWATSDAIWRAAGDRSHDFSWYTRRTSLMAVYGATMLYWLDDPSEDGSDTLAFLERRLADVGGLTRARRRVREGLERLPGLDLARMGERLRR